MQRWEVRGMTPHGEYGPLAGGPEISFPDARQRKSMREAGLKIYVDGKIFKETENKKDDVAGTQKRRKKNSPV